MATWWAYILAAINQRPSIAVPTRTMVLPDWNWPFGKSPDIPIRLKRVIMLSDLDNQ